MTGDVDAYMLYKESQKDDWNELGEESWEEEIMEDHELM